MKERLDVALVSRGLAESREKAQAMIISGTVFLNGQRADKASLAVKEEDTVEARGTAHPYVSRGGLKLEKALKVFPIDVTGVTAMDIGASTGGFTDVLLQNGAAHVYSIDVGYGQLDWKLRNDPRVTVMERTNARAMTREQFPDVPSLAVMDVSFISIRLILLAAIGVMGDEGRFLTLVKPQLEAGRDRVGKKGVVREAETHRDVLWEIMMFVESIGWVVQGMDFSPIRGPEGNIEFLYDLVKKGRERAVCSEEDILRTVAAAHDSF